jgi:hypothetical protein
MRAEELPIDVLEYFLNLLKLSKIYANFVSSLGYETIEEIDLKTVQSLNCRFTCAESSNVSGIYNLWYSCNNIWVDLTPPRPGGQVALGSWRLPPFMGATEYPVGLGFKNLSPWNPTKWYDPALKGEVCSVGITVEERKVSRELLRKECAKPPPYNFYVLFGGLIFPEEGEVVWTIQFGLKNKVPISLRLNNLSFTLVNGISLYDGNQLTLSIWESTRGNYIDVNLLSFDKGLAKDRIHIDYEGNIEEYEKNLRRNPENAYKLATSLLTYLYSNQIFRGNVNEATTFLRHFFSMYTAFLLY